MSTCCLSIRHIKMKLHWKNPASAPSSSGLGYRFGL